MFSVTVGETDFSYILIGHVGAPAPCNHVKLVDVEEMGYFAKNGQGEVGKHNITYIARGQCMNIIFWLICIQILPCALSSAVQRLLYVSVKVAKGILYGDTW